MTRSGFSAAIFSTFGCMPPTFAIFFASNGKFEKSSVPTTRSPAPTAKSISVTFGARETTRVIFEVRATGRPRSSVWAVCSGGAQARKKRRRNSQRRLCLSTFLGIHVVVDAEAVARCGVHLLRRVDRALQLGDAILHFRQLFFDLILQIVDLLLRHLKCGLVELSLLIGQNRHLTSSDEFLS